MQHDALAAVEDRVPETAAFGGARPGRDAPYKDYVLGRAYDEMFARRRLAAAALCARSTHGSPTCRRKN